MQKIVVWTSTNKCNLDCKFCFGREIGKKELGTGDAKQLILRMKERGSKYFVFSGGEPLLRKDIFELAEYAKSIGMNTILHTNGILIDGKNADRIAECFDVVNLPIDGADERANAMMGRGSLGHTVEVFDMLAGKTEITVSTVATKMNLDEIEKVAKLLDGKKLKKWRAFRFQPRLGEAEKNREMFWVSEHEFAGLKAKIKDAEFVSDENEFEKSYVLVSSDGKEY